MKLKTLQDAFTYFADPKRCIAYMVNLRWPDGKATCPTCGSTDVRWLESRKLFCCKNRHAKWQFSVKVGTVMEDSPMPLRDWLIIGWMLSNCRNGISSYEVARTIGITQKSAWFMLHRLRRAMGIETITLQGEVEADESYFSGNPKNKHVGKRTQKPKAAVVGVVERGGMVVASVVPEAKAEAVEALITKSVDKEALVITDAASIYDKLWIRHGIRHRIINHAQDKFKVGNIHTNTIENFWSCLKRTLKGTYIAVRPKHLNAYVQEQSFRFNVRKGLTEEQRFSLVVLGTEGKRLTYRELVG